MDLEKLISRLNFILLSALFILLGFWLRWLVELYKIKPDLSP